VRYTLREAGVFCAAQDVSPSSIRLKPTLMMRRRTQSSRSGDDTQVFCWGLLLVTDRIRLEGEGSMDERTVDELGPVDFLVVEFPAGASNFTGEMARELSSLVEGGVIRVLDLLILRKDDDDAVEAFEVDDLDQLDELRAVEAEIAEVLAAEDIAHLAAAMEPGSTAGVLVWENSWAAPFASAARRSGGQLVASGRIPIQALVASLEAEEATLGKGV
jgi:hypothetical protein